MIQKEYCSEVTAVRQTDMIQICLFTLTTENAVCLPFNPLSLHMAANTEDSISMLRTPDAYAFSR